MENVESNAPRKRQTRATGTLKKSKRLWLQFGASEASLARRFPLFYKNRSYLGVAWECENNGKRNARSIKKTCLSKRTGSAFHVDKWIHAWKDNKRPKKPADLFTTVEAGTIKVSWKSFWIL